jgi:signal transduction histidine kinase
VTIDFRVSGGRLQLRIADDGEGFDPRKQHDGLGLASMARRARDLHGSLEIDSRRGGGTSLTFEMPLRAGRA